MGVTPTQTGHRRTPVVACMRKLQVIMNTTVKNDTVESGTSRLLRLPLNTGAHSSWSLHQSNFSGAPDEPFRFLPLRMFVDVLRIGQ